MSSGSYIPSPVKRVNIDKPDGGTRPLGIPTISDRVGQMACKILIEPELEKVFHRDSYGYRPNKSAHEALGQTKQRCLENDWVIDLDIKGFFDSIDHELLMRAVRKHVGSQWILLYIERWLKASVQLEDGSLEKRDSGTPQGGVISPLLANLYLHYVFDMWLSRINPNILYERYADDCIVHCRSKKQAVYIKDKIKRRFYNCKLELHPEKTKIVYCKDSYRHEKYPQTEFTFLGYTFKPRKCQGRDGKFMTRFLPAISKKAGKKIKNQIKKWKIRKQTGNTLEKIAKEVNSVVRGWLQYYGKFYRSALKSILFILDKELVKWIMNKYKKYRRKWKKAFLLLCKIKNTRKQLFAYW